MKTKLKIYTSFVSPRTLDYVVKENYLPIFIVRFIGNSDLIGGFSGTSIHFQKLSPSSILYQGKRDGKITPEDFREAYLEELSHVDLEECIKKMEAMAEYCEASGVILMGYGSSFEKCHRSILADLLNESGLLESPVEEFKFNF